MDTVSLGISRIKEKKRKEDRNIFRKKEPRERANFESLKTTPQKPHCPTKCP